MSATAHEEEDEPDYMSDDFLAKCIPEDVRPGLKRVRNIRLCIKHVNNVLLGEIMTPPQVKRYHYFSLIKANVNTNLRRRKMSWLKGIGKTRNWKFQKQHLKYKRGMKDLKSLLIHLIRDLKCSARWDTKKVIADRPLWCSCFPGSNFHAPMQAFAPLMINVITNTGDSLGKTNSGRLDPIPIEVKSSRSGLGREDAVKRITETMMKLRQKRTEEHRKNREKQQEVSAQEFRCVVILYRTFL